MDWTWTCSAACPTTPRASGSPATARTAPLRKPTKGRTFPCTEIPRKGNTGKTIFLNYVSWPLYAAGALNRLPGGYDAVFCFNTSPVLMCWPAIKYAKKHKIPFTNYVLDLWPENLYSVLPVKNSFMRWVAQTVSDSLYKRADRLIAMSVPLQKRLIARTGKPEKDVAVISQYCEDFTLSPAMTQSWKPAFPGGSTWCSPARLPRHKAWIWCCAPCWMPALPGPKPASAAGGRRHEPRELASPG